MTRPLARLGVDELEALFETNKHDLPTLKRLIAELKYRNVPRAISLVVKAQKMLMSLESHRAEFTSGVSRAELANSDLAGAPMPTQNGFNFDVPKFMPTDLAKRSPNQMPSDMALQTRAIVLPAIPVAPTLESEPITMSIEHANRVLKTTLASSWDAIEFSRRQIVARAQPDLVAMLEPVNRNVLEDEARQANIAYKVLLRSRS
jgi:hypothetical protein